MGIFLKIYDDMGTKVVNTHEAQTYDLMFGTIKKLMELTKVEEMTDQAELLKTIATSWDEIISILSVVFPECTDDEWNHVKVKELLPIVIQIAKHAIAGTMAIPTEKN